MIVQWLHQLLRRPHHVSSSSDIMEFMHYKCGCKITLKHDDWQTFLDIDNLPGVAIIQTLQGQITSYHGGAVYENIAKRFEYREPLSNWMFISLRCLFRN
jgi:hypothetical protein